MWIKAKFLINNKTQNIVVSRRYYVDKGSGVKVCDCIPADDIFCHSEGQFHGRLSVWLKDIGSYNHSTDIQFPIFSLL